MKLLYLWIHCSENGFIRKQGFNIAGDQFFEYDEEKKTLSSQKKEGYIKDFWNNNCIEDLSVIVGTNGAGKSTLLSEIMKFDSVEPPESSEKKIFRLKNGRRQTVNKIIVYEEDGYIYYDHNFDFEIDTWPIACRKKIEASDYCTKIFVSNSMNNPIHTIDYQRGSVYAHKDTVEEWALIEDNKESEARLYSEKNKVPDYVYPSEKNDDSRYYDDPSIHHYESPYIDMTRKLNELIHIKELAAFNIKTLMRLYFLVKSKCRRYMGKTYNYVTVRIAEIRGLYDISLNEYSQEDKDALFCKLSKLERKEKFEFLNTLILYFLYEFLSCYKIEEIINIEEISLAQVEKVTDFLKDQGYRDIEDSLSSNMTTSEYFVNAAIDLRLFAKLMEDNQTSLFEYIFLTGQQDRLNIELGQNKEFFDRLFIFYERGIPSIFMRHLIFEFEGLSSGEEAMLNLYSRIFWIYNAYECKKDNLILIDEIDLYMHPKWQRELINYLNEDIANLIGKENKAQIIITTHSPIILSDIPKSSILFLEGKDGTCVVDNNKNHRDTFGNNVHTLFLDSFFLNDDGTMGSFAENKINRIIDTLLSKGKIDDENHSILNTINIIGDDLIRNRLLSLYEKKTNRMPLSENKKSEKEINAIDASIEVIKEQIRSLQNAIIELERMK